MQRLEEVIEKSKSKKVVIESPFAGDVEKNVEYAKDCLKDSLKRGESPIVSHLLFPQVLNDNDTQEREQGIQAGLNWLEGADLHVFYVDRGWSKGMLKAFEYNQENVGCKIEIRYLNN